MPFRAIVSRPKSSIRYSLRNSPSRPRPIAGFTLVEVMMAAIILTVGFMGLIQAVTICSGMMDQARRETLAAQILDHEIESLRLLPWDDPSSTNDIVGLPGGSTTVAIDSQFQSTIATSGATFSLTRSVSFIDPSTNANSVSDTGLREATFTLTWVVKTSRHDGSGGLVTFTYTRINSAYFGKYGLNLTYQRS